MRSLFLEVRTEQPALRGPRTTTWDACAQGLGRRASPRRAPTTRGRRTSSATSPHRPGRRMVHGSGVRHVISIRQMARARCSSVRTDAAGVRATWASRRAIIRLKTSRQTTDSSAIISPTPGTNTPKSRRLEILHSVVFRDGIPGTGCRHAPSIGSVIEPVPRAPSPPPEGRRRLCTQSRTASSPAARGHIGASRGLPES